MPETAGTLYIVATPIGNLGDLAPRARETLSQVDVILCEDTRHTGALMKRLSVNTPRRSMHEHNEDRRVPEVIEGLRRGTNYALVSDAGTPLISDPGFRLLAAAREADLPVSPLPGPCALAAAISVAGLPTDRFCFEGFLPARRAARRKRLQSLAGEPRTLVFYETGRRMAEALSDCADAFGPDRPAALCRELTKAYETVYRDTVEGLREILRTDEQASRGECVLVVAGAPATTAARPPSLEQALDLLLEVLPASAAARTIARMYGIGRSEAYELALARSGRKG